MSVAHRICLALVVLTGGCSAPSSELVLTEFDRELASCDQDSDCDDGLACNGVERCGTVSRRCVSGPPMICESDGIDCTIEVCIDPLGTCSVQPIPSSCPGRTECDLTRGCVHPCETPPSGVCDRVSSCGCAAEEGCFADADGLRCAPAGTGGRDDDCDPEAVGGGCAAGYHCVRLGPPGVEAPSRCRRVCEMDEHCSFNASCSVSIGHGELACTRGCDIYRNDDCGEGTGCDLVRIGEAHTYYSDCRAAGPTLRREPCTSDLECAPGLLCVGDPEGGADCLGVCGHSSDCRLDEFCGRFDETVILDGLEVRPCLPR